MTIPTHLIDFSAVSTQPKEEEKSLSKNLSVPIEPSHFIGHPCTSKLISTKPLNNY